LYVSWRPFSHLVGIGLCCHLVPCCFFTDCSGSNLLSSTSPQPCLPLPLFLLPWHFTGLVIWIMIFFCKTKEDLLGPLVKFFHYSEPLHHEWKSFISGMLTSIPAPHSFFSYSSLSFSLLPTPYSPLPTPHSPLHAHTIALLTIIISKLVTSTNRKNSNQRNLKSTDPNFAGCKNSYFLYFYCYNATIYVVSLYKRISILYFNGLRQDPTIGIEEKQI
jgi:hypothetical protein